MSDTLVGVDVDDHSNDNISVSSVVYPDVPLIVRVRLRASSHPGVPDPLYEVGVPLMVI
jgi:hypothetical protein